jgi:hypothetical protein
MKKYIILIFGLFTTLWSYSQDYYPFPDSNAIWNSKYGGYYGTPIVRFGLNGDTVINNQVYKKVYQIVDDSTLNLANMTYYAAIRENASKQIFAKMTDYDDEILIYDFSLNIGDTILIDEKYGTVEDINLSYTTVKTWDWKRYVLPNIRMLQQNFMNFTLVDKYQWVYIEFWAAYENDLQEVERIALDCAKQSKFTLEDNVPYFWIMEMAMDGYKCWLASWADNPSSAWSLRNDLRTRLIMEFSKKNIKYHSLHHVVENAEMFR